MGIGVRPCCCNPACCSAICQDSGYSGQLQVTLAGFANNVPSFYFNCGNCAAYNGTFILSCSCVGSGTPCYWWYADPSAGCGGLMLSVSIGQHPFGPTPYNDVYVQLVNYISAASCGYTGGYLAIWAQGGPYGGGTFPDPLTCGSLSNYSVPLYQSPPGDCYGNVSSPSSPTCTITAL